VLYMGVYTGGAYPGVVGGYIPGYSRRALYRAISLITSPEQALNPPKTSPEQALNPPKTSSKHALNPPKTSSKQALILSKTSSKQALISPAPRSMEEATAPRREGYTPPGTPRYCTQVRAPSPVPASRTHRVLHCYTR